MVGVMPQTQAVQCIMTMTPTKNLINAHVENDKPDCAIILVKIRTDLNILANLIKRNKRMTRKIFKSDNPAAAVPMANDTVSNGKMDTKSMENHPDK